MDTWDGPDDEPIIFHGYTLTSRIFFRDVLEAIKQYAFVASQLVHITFFLSFLHIFLFFGVL